jgi:hypothetical protein
VFQKAVPTQNVTNPVSLLLFTVRRAFLCSLTLCSTSLLISVFLKLVSAELQRSAKGFQAFPENKMRNDGGVSIAVINLCVPINIRVATFDTDHSVTEITHTTAASVQKLRDSAVKSVSTARHRQKMCQAKRSG